VQPSPAKPRTPREREALPPVRYCGREFRGEEIQRIREVIAADPQRSRYQISQRVCETLGWRKPNGTLKDMSCRVAMLRMQEDGLIQLPPPRQGHPNRIRYRRRSVHTDPASPLEVPLSALSPIQISLVVGRPASRLWNEYIDRYHYLGYKTLPGAQLRYFVTARGQMLALLGFGAAAWKTAPRDQFIGWSAAQRVHNLHRVVNNARFLILPWVHCPNLASHLLGAIARRIRDDWRAAYAYAPVLLETFVHCERFRGTCYQAANWIYLGETQGRGKLDASHHAKAPKKAVWLYPLTRDFRTWLCTTTTAT
jgi:hypothetical protein